MEGAKSSGHDASQESGRQIRITTVMKQSRTSRHIVEAKRFPSIQGDHSRGRENWGGLFGPLWFLPSSIWSRTFSSLQHLNETTAWWLAHVADVRVHKTTHR